MRIERYRTLFAATSICFFAINVALVYRLSFANPYTFADGVATFLILLGVAPVSVLIALVSLFLRDLGGVCAATSLILSFWFLLLSFGLQSRVLFAIAVAIPPVSLHDRHSDTHHVYRYITDRRMAAGTFNDEPQPRACVIASSTLPTIFMTFSRWAWWSTSATILLGAA